MSTILPGYVQTPFGGWVSDEGTGPYLVIPTEEETPTYKALPSGFWEKSDGSGPYFYDVETGEAIEATSVFRSI